MDLLSQHPMFSTDPCTKGFDISAGKKWIYPENYPLREYQFSIVKTALFNNTLVGLPTGLGKTFIAAVVMYNFWRWYPEGIIIFLAPTKPLVAQQIDACHDIMGIPISQTIELTGNTNPQQRQLAWTKKRVIFATPQTFQKDLEKDIVPKHLIKCVVIDEAHKALGKYAYCETIRMLYEDNQYFRILALSATPGNKVMAVQEVIRNLHITHLELRDDSSPDIVPYINQKKFDIIQVRLGADLTRFQERYMTIIDPFYRILIQSNVINCPLTNISKGRMYFVWQDYQKRDKRTIKNPRVHKYLPIVYTMVYAKELLTNHGLRAFVNFYQNHSDKFWLKDVPELEDLLNDIKEYLGEFPDVSNANNSLSEVPENIRFGHDKFDKLKDVLVQHFKNAAESKIDTRAIVFVEFRDSVNEIYVLLHKFKPLIRPQIFVGQAKAGLKQKDQKQALNNFRQNKVNVLISTSVGEEGLDVGEVDLIICFDNAKHSTTRLVQRMGRTGRKRNGRIIALVTEGKESHELKSVISKRDSFNSQLLKSSGIITALDNVSPRMVPDDIDPECLKMHMTVIPKTPQGKSKGKAKGEKRKYSRKNAKEAEDTEKGGPSDRDDQPNFRKPKQSSLMNFLQSKTYQAPSTQDNEIVSMRVEEIQNPLLELLQPKNKLPFKVRPCDAKLLSTDKEACEFLTLCAMKESTKDLVNSKMLENIKYMPGCSKDEVDLFENFEVPPLQILDCIRTLEEFVPADKSPRIEFDYIPEDDVTEWMNSPGHEFENNSRTPDGLELSKGRFEDLLDESSDSDETLYHPDETLPSNERIDLTMDPNNSVFPAAENYLKKEGEGATAPDLSHSVVENGAFEDLLNTSSDESIIVLDDDFNEPQKNTKVNRNESPVKMEECKELKNTGNELNSANKIDIELEDDFGSWEEAQQKRELLSSTVRVSSPHKVKAQRSLMNSFEQVKDKDKGEIPVDVNSSRSNSPDLCRPLDPHKMVRSRLNMTLNSLSCKSMGSVDQINSKIEFSESDDDVFGVNSLLADSDFEENEIVVDKLDVGKENCVDKRESVEKKCEKISDSVEFVDQGVVEKVVHEQVTENFKNNSSDRVENDVKYAGNDLGDQVERNVPKHIENNLEMKNVSKHVDDNLEGLVAKYIQEDTEKSADEIEQSRSKEDEDLKETLVDELDWSSDFELSPTPITESKFFSKTSGSSTPSTVSIFRVNSISRQNSNLRLSQKENNPNFIPVNKQTSEEEFKWISIDKSTSQNNSKWISTERPTSQNNSKWISTEKSTLQNNCKSISTEKSTSQNNSKWISTEKSTSQNNSKWISTEKSTSQNNSKWISTEKSTSQNNLKWISTEKSTSEDNSKWISTEKSTTQSISNKWITAKKRSEQNLVNKHKPSNNSRQTLPQSYKISLQSDSNSDDDFAPTKIEKIDKMAPNILKRNFVNDKILSDSRETVKDRRLASQPPSRLRSSSITNLSKFVAPDRFPSGTVNTSGMSSPHCRLRRSTSFDDSNNRRKRKRVEHKRSKKCVKRSRNTYIDDEAEVSSEGDYSLGSSGGDSNDEDLEDFVSYSQYHDQSVDMKAHYLQSLRSPKIPGRFLIKEPKNRRPDIEIYSQVIQEENNSYLHDSFCVDEEEEEENEENSDETIGEITLLDAIENKISKQKRKRRHSSTQDSRSKRKRIVQPSDDSSDDDTDLLRAQIAEESMILRNS